MLPDELIEVPEYLKGELTGANVMPMCDFCTEIACETDGMACGETCSQGCHGQCTVVQCGQCSGAWVDARYANHPAKIPVSPVSHPASRQRKTLPAMVPSRWAKLPAILLK